nr:lengsin [Paramormyrops kingsleyae]
MNEAGDSSLKTSPIQPGGHPHHPRPSTDSPEISHRCEALFTVQPSVRRPVDENVTGEDSGTSQAIAHIKQVMTKDAISLVRFEASDLHGISRSKMVPAHHFHEKALHGVAVPRSCLELTLSPQDNEVDHMTAAGFSSDVLLVPDLLTFRSLPWAAQTARVICDSCSITGLPLKTAPRHVASQVLAQLHSLGFSLRASFSYECCIFSVPEKISSKTLLFPGATLLSNDLPFFHLLVNSMYLMDVDVDSFATASGPGQIEFSLRPESGIRAADSAFTFRTGMKETARKQGYLASFLTNSSFYNCGVFSHSVWDAARKRNLFHSAGGQLSEIGSKWLAGLLHHCAALSCLSAPSATCRRWLAKAAKEPQQAAYATYGCNDNSCSFSVKLHGDKGTRIDSMLGSAMGNPYIVLAATVAAGMDGIRQNLSIPSGNLIQQKKFLIPCKLEDALDALDEDCVIRGALGDAFVQYFIDMKRLEMETEEMDTERDKFLEYFI